MGLCVFQRAMSDHGFAAAVQQEKEDNFNDNTFLSYNPKKLEFISFCDHIYQPPMSLENKHRLTPDKFYNFYIISLVVVNIKPPVGRKQRMYLNLLEVILRKRTTSIKTYFRIN